MDKTTLYLTPEQRRRLREAARRSGRRQADLIRAALDAYLADNPVNRPRSIGAGEDGELGATDTEAWLRERWGSQTSPRATRRDFGVVAAEGTITVLPSLTERS